MINTLFIKEVGGEGGGSEITVVKKSVWMNVQKQQSKKKKKSFQRLKMITNRTNKLKHNGRQRDTDTPSNSRNQGR